MIAGKKVLKLLSFSPSEWISSHVGWLAASSLVVIVKDNKQTKLSSTFHNWGNILFIIVFVFRAIIKKDELVKKLPSYSKTISSRIENIRLFLLGVLIG